jgi:uncharacterized protein (DUF2236 family)
MEVARKVNRERVVILGWSRAILLQLAHPLVAAGVAEHSGFSGGRFARLRRLNTTVGAMQAFVFGGADRSARTAARINAIHDRVHGTLSHATAAYPAGSPYSAADPELLAWVHVTLLESVPLAYERFVAPLSPQERDAYCTESAESARLLRLPEHLLPRTSGELDAAMARVRSSGRLEITPAAREVARQLLYPPLGDPTRPGAWLNRLVTTGLLPPDIREAYGLRWNAGRERAFHALAATIRALLPLVPPWARFWPDARRTRHPAPQ